MISQNKFSIAAAIEDLLFPRNCLVCSEYAGGYVCSECLAGLPYITHPVCMKCGIHLEYGGDMCLSCQKQSFAFENVRAVFAYRGGVRKLIAQFKFKMMNYLAKYLAQIMIDNYYSRNYHFDIGAVIAVPLYSANLRERGFNQSQLLADCISKKIGIELLDGILLREKRTAPQYSLSKRQRLVNMKGAFSVANPSKIKGLNILLIDDIATTLATLNESAAALKSCGAAKVFAYVLARD